MGSHINKDGLFQSDKYPTCPPGKVPLSVKDPMAQDLLWEYAQRRRNIDGEFADDLQKSLIANGFVFRWNLVPSAVGMVEQHTPTCMECGTAMELRMWERPGGAPGNGWGCPKCHPWPAVP